MNAIMKLTTVALGVMGIAGGAALAQTSSDPKADSPTANVSISPGSNLKRDASLSSTPKPAAILDGAATSDSSSTTTVTSTSTTSAAPAPVATTTTVSQTPVASADTSLQPRPDRN